MLVKQKRFDDELSAASLHFVSVSVCNAKHILALPKYYQQRIISKTLRFETLNTYDSKIGFVVTTQSVA